MRSVKKYAKSLMKYQYPTHCIFCKEPLTRVYDQTETAQTIRDNINRINTECIKCTISDLTSRSKFKIETFRPDARLSLNSITIYHQNYTIVCYPEDSVLDPESRIYFKDNHEPVIITPFIEWNWDNLQELEQQIKMIIAFS